jgi:hypothetical protein
MAAYVLLDSIPFLSYFAGAVDVGLQFEVMELLL